MKKYLPHLLVLIGPFLILAILYLIDENVAVISGALIYAGFLDPFHVLAGVVAGAVFVPYCRAIRPILIIAILAEIGSTIITGLFYRENRLYLIDYATLIFFRFLVIVMIGHVANATRLAFHRV